MKPLFEGSDPPPKERPDSMPGYVDGLRCAEPGCQGVLQLRWSPRLGKAFYGCSRYPACPGTLPANDDGSPRGDPRTKELQGWRVKAHAAFDAIWKESDVHRNIAYAWLSRVMVLPREEAHIHLFDVVQCQRVIALVEEKGPGTPFWESWYNPGKRHHPKKRPKWRG